MKGTTKLIVSFGVAIALVATILVMAIFNDGSKDDDTGNKGYQLQSTTTTLPQNTDAWINIDDLANDLATATDPSEAPETTILPDGSVVILTTGPGVSYIYVDENGNVVDPSNVSNPVTQPPVSGTPDNTTTTIIDDATIPDQGNTDVELSEFEIDPRTGYITKYNGSGGYVSLMNVTKINGVQVKGIGDGAFKGSAVSHIDIPAHISYIGNNAFENCTKLSAVTFTNSSTKVTIGFRAFSGCTKLSNIKLPICTVVGQSAFENCSSLKKVEIPSGSLEIGRACFYNCTSLETVYIPKSVDVIGSDAFGKHNPNLTIYTPDGSEAEDYARNAGINVELE